MIRGTTPTHTFQIPISVADLKEVRITYEQMGRKILEKTEKELLMEGKEISFTLTQEESLKFKASAPVDLQVKVLTTSGTVLASPVIRMSVYKILNTEVLE